MRFLLGIILLAAALTGALLWNVRAHDPLPVEAGGRPAGLGLQAPPTPADRVVLVIGYPPGSNRDASIAQEAATPPPAAQTTPEIPPEEPAPQATRRVRLQKGETVYGLAQRLLGKGGRYREILELNHLSEEQARRLKEGTWLQLPPR